MNIRYARPEDAQKIQTLMKKVWIDTYPNDKEGVTIDSIKKLVADWNTPQKVASFAEKIRTKKPTTEHWLAEVDGKLVGNMVATGEKLRVLYIDPEYQNTGIGSALLGKVKVSSLEVVRYNTQAISFYQKHGFVVIGQSSKDFGDVQLPFSIMQK